MITDRRMPAAALALCVLATLALAPGGASAALWDDATFGVAAADEVKNGVYIFTDYVYDDGGANTDGAPGGDYAYPAPGSPYLRNAADLVELRVRPDAGAQAIEFGVRLNTVVDPSLAVMAIGIADGTAPLLAAPWPFAAGVRAVGVRWVLTIRAGQATVDDLLNPQSTILLGAVTAHNDTPDGQRQLENTFSVSIPVSLLGLAAVPTTGSWTLHAATGLWNTAVGVWHQPSTAGPAPYDAAFISGAFGNLGNFQQNEQADLLLTGDLTLAAGTLAFDDFPDRIDPVATGRVSRIYPSPVSAVVGEGITDWTLEIEGQQVPSLNHYRGLFLPYIAWVPTDFDTLPKPLPLFTAMHGFSQTHLGNLNSFADGTITVKAYGLSPLGAGETTTYKEEGEVDVMSALEDFQAHYPVDEDRIYLSGVSMGGQGTFNLVTHYPDVFAAAFSIIGTGQGTNNEGLPVVGDERLPSNRWPGSTGRELLENVLNVPFRMHNGAADPVVNPSWPAGDVLRMQELGNDHQWLLFATGSHTPVPEYTNAVFHQLLDGCATPGVPGCDPAADPGGVVRETRPARVRYKLAPNHFAPEIGLVYAGAYWVSGMQVREFLGEGEFGLVDATSHAFASKIHVEGESFGPDTGVFAPTGGSYTYQGLRRTSAPEAEQRLLTATLTNLSAVAFDLRHAGLIAEGAAFGDVDADGVPDGSDNCPFEPNPGQSDVGGLGTGPPDGIGDACQCGDVSGNGVADGSDATAVERHGIGVPVNPLFAQPDRCDVTCNGLCNGQDANALRREVAGLLPNLFQNKCRAATGAIRVEVATDGPSDVTLFGLLAGTDADLDGTPAGQADANGSVTIAVPSGEHVIQILP